MSASLSAPRAVIFGCEGLSLTATERDFFRDTDPLGFILFARNVETPDQVAALVADLRETVGRDDAPVLIDQEGGRVQRLGPPHWPTYPAADVFADLYESNPEDAVEAATLNAQLMANDLAALGIDVDCAPVLDLAQGDADPIIGDRAAGRTVDAAIALGRAVCLGLMAGGVLPVIKHIPGHGRATVDSHKHLPEVDAPLGELDAHDFKPFQALNTMPIAMTAHIVYADVDADQPATLSERVVADIIRGRIGFGGLLLTDDLSMKALKGGFDERARGSLDAGCDVVLHCNGEMGEMEKVARGARALSPDAEARFDRAISMKKTPDGDFDVAATRARVEELLGRKVYG